jgi:hypothetical protein
MKKWVNWAAIAFVLFFLITAPTAAASLVHSAIHGLGTVAHGLSNFVTSLAGWDLDAAPDARRHDAGLG